MSEIRTRAKTLATVRRLLHGRHEGAPHASGHHQCAAVTVLGVTYQHNAGYCGNFYALAAVRA
jgi:hypothetical protein